MLRFFVIFLLSMSHLTSLFASVDDGADATTHVPRVHSPFDFGVLFDPHLLSPARPSPADVLEECSQKLASIHPKSPKSTHKYLDVIEDLTKAYRQEDVGEEVATKLARLCAKTLLDILQKPGVSYPLALENKLYNQEELSLHATRFAQQSADPVLLARAYTAVAINTPKHKITFTDEILTKPQLLYWAYKICPENECTQQALILFKLLKFWKDDTLPIDGAIQFRQRFVEKLFAISLSPFVSRRMSQSIHFKMYEIWNQTEPFCVFGVDVKRHTLEGSAKELQKMMRTSQGKRRAFETVHARQTPSMNIYPLCLQGVDSLPDLIRRALPVGATPTTHDLSLFYYSLYE